MYKNYQEEIGIYIYIIYIYIQFVSFDISKILMSFRALAFLFHNFVNYSFIILFNKRIKNNPHPAVNEDL